jgi:hypothetical protein
MANKPASPRGKFLSFLFIVLTTRDLDPVIDKLLVDTGLAEFKEKFKGEELWDLPSVQDMTHEQLKDLGVNTMGARNRFLQAVKALVHGTK